jgi:protein-disulfide isomerase
MSRLAILVCAALLVALLAPVLHAQDAWYPIKADDGSPVANHRLPVELTTQLDALPGTVVVANPKGSISLYEFYDLNCPYCRQAAKELPSLVQEDSDLRLVLVPYPVLGIPSIQAGRIELAVAKLGTPETFYRFHQRVYESRGTVDARRALAVAKEIGLDSTAVLTTANDPTILDTLKSHAAFGNALNLAVTPSFVIQGVAILGYAGQQSMRSIIHSVAKCGLVVCAKQ